MIEFILIVLVASLVFYIVFAGADFGAGIYEFLCLLNRKSSRQKLVEDSIGPIWESNHIWIILVVVILFMGFPKIFFHLSNIFHIPLIFMLIGIIFRGTAFAFRHYDPIIDQSQKYYTWIFGLSSVWTAFWQGVIIAGLFRPLPVITLEYPQSFAEVYLAPWVNPFNFCVGIFVCAIYLYLAQTFFLSEVKNDNQMKKALYKEIWRSLLFVFIAGIFVFLSSLFYAPYFLNNFIANPISVSILAFCTLLFIPIVYTYSMQYNLISRILVAIQVALIFLAVTIKRFPLILEFKNGSLLTIADSLAPEATLRQLFYALVVGVILIFPLLIILLKIFKSPESSSSISEDDNSGT